MKRTTNLAVICTLLLMTLHALPAYSASSSCIPGIPCLVKKTKDDPFKSNDGSATGPNAVHISRNDAGVCDADFMNQIYAKAFNEAERQNTKAGMLIKKPDSVLEYSCFDQIVSLAAKEGGPIFSESTEWTSPGLAGTYGGSVVDMVKDKVKGKLPKEVLGILKVMDEGSLSALSKEDLQGMFGNTPLAEILNGLGSNGAFLDSAFLKEKLIEEARKGTFGEFIQNVNPEALKNLDPSIVVDSFVEMGKDKATETFNNATAEGKQALLGPLEGYMTQLENAQDIVDMAAQMPEEALNSAKGVFKSALASKSPEQLLELAKNGASAALPDGALGDAIANQIEAGGAQAEALISNLDETTIMNMAPSEVKTIATAAQSLSADGAGDALSGMTNSAKTAMGNKIKEQIPPELQSLAGIAGKDDPTEILGALEDTEFGQKASEYLGGLTDSNKITEVLGSGLNLDTSVVTDAVSSLTGGNLSDALKLDSVKNAIPSMDTAQLEALAGKGKEALSSVIEFGNLDNIDISNAMSRLPIDDAKELLTNLGDKIPVDQVTDLIDKAGAYKDKLLEALPIDKFSEVISSGKEKALDWVKNGSEALLKKLNFADLSNMDSAIAQKLVKILPKGIMSGNFYQGIMNAVGLEEFAAIADFIPMELFTGGKMVFIGGWIKRMPVAFVMMSTYMGDDFLDKALEPYILTSLKSYVDTNFSNNFLGGSASFNNKISTQIGNGTYSCDTMNKVFQLSKCMNFSEGAEFYTFDTLTKEDPRKNILAACQGGTRLSETPEYLSLARNTDHTYVNIEELKHDFLELRTAKNVCAPPIKTGVSWEVLDLERDLYGNDVFHGSNYYDDVVCPTLGCHYDMTKKECIR